MENLRNIGEKAVAEINLCAELKELEELRILYLGKKGPIQEALKVMRDLPNEERVRLGKMVNDTKIKIGKALEQKKTLLENLALMEKLEKETIDVTLPSSRTLFGARHLMGQMVTEIEDIFVGMGYNVVYGPEMETDYYNFEMMNQPKGHPARDMQDSFYITEELLLRSHTSPVQARTMLAAKGKGPISIICPGVVYRRDDDDATHSHQFFQIEALTVDKGITMSDLQGTLDYFLKKIFGENRVIRFRPSFFPFTEPSVEVDISCACGGSGCPMCKHTGFIELLGAGMVHPNVLKMGGFDPLKYQGFAFGVGVERMALLKYGIDDIRHLYTNDLRFNRQFL